MPSTATPIWRSAATGNRTIAMTLHGLRGSIKPERLARQICGGATEIARMKKGTRHTTGFVCTTASIRTRLPVKQIRSEEHTSELQSLMRISYAVFCLKKKKEKQKSKKYINS